MVGTYIPDSILGRTETGRYWHKVGHHYGSGKLRTWCSQDPVTALVPKADLKDHMARCWKRGCL